MLAIDPMGEKNGGIFVVSGSHTDCSQLIGNSELIESYERGEHGEVVFIELELGDMLYTHPCLAHF